MVTRHLRRFVAPFVIVALVFAQLAMTAHACPVHAAPAMMHGVLPAEAGEHPCSGMATTSTTPQANACEVHCTDAAVSSASPDLPPIVLTALPLPPLLVAARAAADVAARTPYAALPGAPPPILQFCRLLI